MKGSKAGYSVILCNSDGSEAKEETYIQVLLSKQVDGLIFIASSSSLKGIRRVLDAKVPIVAVDREIPHSPITQIMVDNWQGGHIAGQYLVQLGHRRFGYIAGPNNTTPSGQRLQGFKDALTEAGIELDDHNIIVGDFRFGGGQKAMEDLLRRGLEFTAVFAANDLMAMGAISALHTAGLQVPGDVSVMGFDDIPYAVITLPPMTTVAQPIEELGRQCIHALLERMKRPDSPPQRTVLLPHLVVRESCASVGTGGADLA
jgi:LacI family transcriptional regulator